MQDTFLDFADFSSYLTFTVSAWKGCCTIIVNSKCQNWEGRMNLSKTAAWGKWLFLLSEGGGYILGEAYAWGDQQFFLNIFVFVILWCSVKEYKVIITVPWFQEIS